MKDSVVAGGARVRAHLMRFALSTALCTSVVAPALAQTSQAAPPPRYNNVDDLGIDLTTGQPNISFTEGSIGPADGGIAFIRTWTSGAGWTDNWTGGAFSKTVGGITTWYVERGSSKRARNTAIPRPAAEAVAPRLPTRPPPTMSSWILREGNGSFPAMAGRCRKYASPAAPVTMSRLPMTQIHAFPRPASSTSGHGHIPSRMSGLSAPRWSPILWGTPGQSYPI